jgi:uncharacterized phiE125 gp8 family phage protein
MLKLITPPATYPLTLAQAKEHLRVETDDEDTLITSYLDAATQLIEAQTGLCLVTQTWEYHISNLFFTLTLPKMPVQSITSIKYYDTDNNLQTWDSSNYRLLNPYQYRARIEPINQLPPVNWRRDAVQIRFVCGFETIPERAKQAVRLALGVFHNERSGEITGTISKQLEVGIDRLCHTLRAY